MAKQPPRRSDTTGPANIVLTVEEHERLDGFRRQVGALTSRLGQVTLQLRAERARLSAIDDVLGEASCDCRGDERSCLRCRVSDARHGRQTP